MIRLLALVAGLFLLGACAPRDLDETPVPLGDFSLGHNVVVAPKMQMGPVSRRASEEEWIAALTKAVDDRFGRYEGEQIYHFGISVEGYMLAPPGLPLVYNPKSALVINVTLWDDAAGRKLNEAPHQIIVLETPDGASLLLGSGLTRSKAEQIEGLSYNAVRAIQDWMVTQSEAFGWFGPDERVAPKGSESPQRVVVKPGER